MPIIYHVTTEEDWKESQSKGYYEHSSLKEEGFIHCSQQQQVADVLERYFAGKTNLLKLVIDTDKLTSPYVFDWSPSAQDTFPHVYGVINAGAIIDAVAL